MGYEWDFETAIRYLPYILVGVGMTFLVAASSMVGGLILGVLVAVIRVAGRRPWTSIATAYTDFFRSTPILAQLMWVFYALPFLTGFSITGFIAAFIALSLNMGAFLGELFRAGITSIGRGQTEAALALGMRSSQMYRRIILPQALRRVAPPLMTYWVHLFKDTSIVSIVAVMELTYRARWSAMRTFRYLEMFTLLGIIYVVLTWPQSRAADWLYEKFRVKE
jgi:polar amino acid transport system permease protein